MYNRDKQIFEGIWDIGAFGIERFNDGYYAAQSDGPNVYKLFEGHSDVEGDERFPIDFEAVTHWENLTASKGYLQALHGIVLEGWIAGGAQFDFKVWADFASDPFLSGTFSFDEEGLLNGEATQAFLGGNPMAIDPMGVSYGEIGSDGRRHFQWRRYFPFKYANYFSRGLSASTPDNDFEVTRFAYIMKEDPSVNVNKIKSAN